MKGDRVTNIETGITNTIAKYVFALYNYSQHHSKHR